MAVHGDHSLGAFTPGPSRTRSSSASGSSHASSIHSFFSALYKKMTQKSSPIEQPGHDVTHSLNRFK